MKELIEEMAKALVDHPEEVRVTAIESVHNTILELRTHPDDMGKVIGRCGRTVNAMRILLAAAGMKQKKRCSLDVVQAGRPMREMDAR